MFVHGDVQTQLLITDVTLSIQRITIINIVVIWNARDTHKMKVRA